MNRVKWFFMTAVATMVIGIGGVMSAAESQTWNCGHPNNAGGRSSVTATLSGGTLTISGQGPMEDYGFANSTSWFLPPWYSSRASIDTVIIEDGVTSIGVAAFFSVSLRAITIPTSVGYIGEDAFRSCTRLTSIISLRSRPPSLFNRLSGHGEPFNGRNRSAIDLYVPRSSIADYRDRWGAFNIYGFNNTPEGLLTAITTSSGTLSPIFNPGVMDYTVVLPSDVNSLTITATPLFDEATITGIGEKEIGASDNTFEIITRAPGIPAFGPVAETYTITATKTVAVAEIIADLPNTIITEIPLALSGTVAPANATNKNITWSVLGVTGKSTTAAITNNTLQTSGIGTVTVGAIIPNGTSNSAEEDYVQTFTINVEGIAVTGIHGTPISVISGEPFSLNNAAAAVPANATYRNITWSIVDVTGEGADAIIVDNVIYTTGFGTLLLKATIEKGMADSEDTNYEQLFDVTIGTEVVVSIVTTDRNVPQINDEVAVVAPVNRPTVTLTVGPNPVDRQSVSVNFYVSGMTVRNGSLRIYDATGNIVRWFAVNKNTVTWDLKDRRGRLVAEGTYLVRGTLSSISGKREIVSAVVGVR